MARPVRVFLPVQADGGAVAAVFASDPAQWLPSPRRDSNDPSFAIPVHAGGIEHTVRTDVGDAWQRGTTWWRSIAWDPVSDAGEAGGLNRFLPSFSGEIGLHTGDDARTTLIVDGEYDPPGGVLGTAVDAVGLRRVARSTMTRFAADVADKLIAATNGVHDDCR
ncbi:MAG: hypothetical protein WD360_07570 [Nitriliruptoraceae bacterium]